MKKLCALLALMLLSASMFIACGKEDVPADNPLQGAPLPAADRPADTQDS